MVREITMFELHFDDARFGPSFGGESEEDEETTEDDADTAGEQSGGSKLRPLLAMVGLALLVVGVRRLAKRRSGEDYDISIDEDAETVATEQ